MHNEMEKRVLDDMRQFAFKPDGWEISFVQGYDIREASERQRWWLFNLYIIMKQQATDMEALKHCFEFYLEHPSPPPKYHQQVSPFLLTKTQYLQLKDGPGGSPTAILLGAHSLSSDHQQLY